MNVRTVVSVSLIGLVGALSIAFTPVSTLHAQTTAEIQQQIADHNKKISDLEAEISKYQAQLNALGNQHATLASSIKALDITRAQLNTKIKSLQQQISALNLELNQLSRQINDKQKAITLNKRVLSKSLLTIAQSDQTTVVEQVFSSEDLGTAWSAVDANVTLNNALRDQTDTLVKVKKDLTDQQQMVTKTQAKLVSVTTDLGTQKKAVDVTVSQKSELLKQTKNQESSYQKLIATKRAQQKVFESALTSLESKLKSVSAGSIPRTGNGILAWPTTIHTVTQYFGNTAFAQSGAYAGKGHNGIDIGIPTGTPIGASLEGTVLATGNTDSIPGCYSFGKWVMVKHPNGLSTMYAHLSSISVSSGQSVSTGTILGYSGMTGYATGPHLHYGVYASAGVQITTLGAARGATSPCAGATMPIAPLNAYLNPMSYL